MATKEEWNKMVERLQGLIDDEEFVGDITISDEEYEFLISCLSEEARSIFILLIPPYLEPYLSVLI